MLSSQTQFVDLPSGDHVWTRRIGHSPRKLMLLHNSTEMPWQYLTTFTNFAKQNDIEIILVEMLGSYLSDQPDTDRMPSVAERMSEIQHVVAHYRLDKFAIHGIADTTSLAREYVKDHANARRLLTDQDELASARATEVLGNFDNPDYLNMLRTRLRYTVTA